MRNHVVSRRHVGAQHEIDPPKPRFPGSLDAFQLVFRFIHATKAGQREIARRALAELTELATRPARRPQEAPGSPLECPR